MQWNLLLIEKSMRNIYGILLMVATLLVGSPAHSRPKIKPKLPPANNPLCIESVCLNDPIGKFNSLQFKAKQVFPMEGGDLKIEELYQTYPVCSFQPVNVHIEIDANRLLRVTFYPYAGLKGTHYRAGTISEAISGSFSLDEARKIFDTMKTGGFKETSPYPFTFSAKRISSIKDQDDIVYYLNLKWQPEGMHIVYSTNQIPNQSELLDHPECKANEPG